MKDIIDSFEGMNGLLDPSKLKKSELALMENFTLKSYGNIGALVSRNGFTRYNSNQIASGGSGVGSMFEATLNGTDYIIANIINGSSSALYYEDTPYTGAWTSITGSGGSGRAYKLNYASFRDKVYIANNSGGTSSNTVWDGTTAGFYDMGCPPPNSYLLTLTGSNASGSLTVSSTYTYAVSFLYDNNQESPLMGYKKVVMGASDDTVTITTIPTTQASGTSNTRIKARKLYRTKSNALEFYFLDVIPNNTDTRYVDGKADTILIETYDKGYLFRRATSMFSNYITVHKERSILANLYSTALNAPDTSGITLTGSDTGGGLGSGVYKYRFYKAIAYPNNSLYDGFIASNYTEKSIDLGALGYTGTDNKVTIDWSALTNEDYWGTFLIERTENNGNDFYYLGAVSYSVDSYVDGATDATLQPKGIPLDASSDTTVSFPNNIIVSDAGKPDLFSTIETAQDGTLIPAGNEWNVGEPITGIHSEENRIVIFGNKNIYELDTTAQSRQFWRLNKIVSGIGSDDGLQVQCGTRYMFAKSNTTGNGKIAIYEWDGRSEPQLVSLPIQSWIEDNRVSSIRDLIYDQYNNRVFAITAPTASINVAVLVYNLDLRDNSGFGKWELWLNATNLNFYVGVNTKSYGVLFGGGDGYVHYQDTSNRDTIAGTNRTFTTKLRTKTFEAYDRDLKPRRFRADITASGAVTPILKTAVDGTLNGGDSMTALASGFNRPNQTAFTNAQDKHYRQVYFQLEMTENVQQKVHGLLIDLDEKSEASGGR